MKAYYVGIIAYSGAGDNPPGRKESSGLDAHVPLTADGAVSSYPIVLEKRLCALIGSRDRHGAQAVLNDLLGAIYLDNGFELAAIRPRLIELVVVLSRAAIDAGADVQEVFAFNRDCFGRIERFQSLEELSVWLTGVLHRFMRLSFDMSRFRRADVITRVAAYVQSHYDRRITLDDLAAHTFLSRPYLCRLFKAETGRSLTDYIRTVRIDKSRELLLDTSLPLAEVAGRCGFDDQSYFTRLFRRQVGVTPKRYRDSRGRIG